MVNLSKGVTLVKASDVEARKAFPSYAPTLWVGDELRRNNLKALQYALSDTHYNKLGYRF